MVRNTNPNEKPYDKLNKTVYLPRKKTSKNVDGDYDKVNLFNNVNEEFV